MIRSTAPKIIGGPLLPLKDWPRGPPQVVAKILAASDGPELECHRMPQASCNVQSSVAWHGEKRRVRNILGWTRRRSGSATTMSASYPTGHRPEPHGNVRGPGYTTEGTGHPCLEPQQTTVSPVGKDRKKADLKQWFEALPRWPVWSQAHNLAGPRLRQDLARTKPGGAPAPARPVRASAHRPRRRLLAAPDGPAAQDGPADHGASRRSPPPSGRT